MDDEDSINIQIFVPELQVRKCLVVLQDDFIWDVKRKLLATLPQALPQAFNYGLFLPPCDGRAGKFLLEDRTIRDYPFHDCVPYLELKYKKRVYKLLNLDEKQLKNLHTKSNLRKLMDYVQSKNAEKVEKLCTQGLDANFHDAQGETPLTLAAGVANNRAVIVALIGGGAHIDFRNSEGQTAMHKASFLSSFDNVKTLLELGASPNYRDPIGLTPLYYNMLTTDSNDQVCEMLLREAADVGVTDMHGNHELHQACKNGLVKHAEHLLYFGVNVDIENVNGNTPLHVCAVNNRPEVARVLLFRGADNHIGNKQSQTALHVAHIVGSHEVAEIISGHNPQMSVPYRGTPQYSTRRRLNSTISRRRSLSQSSLCSQDIYRTPQQSRKTTMVAPSPTPSRISRSTITPSEYGTMRRYAPEVGGLAPGQETNTPRILVIPRGPKGFGFILRGAKHADAVIEFAPSPAAPALQFFEGVDMSGMAMKAGLRPGDFLLEIDGFDVRCASHEQVVHLIQQAGDTITLKVITVEAEPILGGGTVQRRHHSVGRAPPPPMRHPSTSISLRGSQSLYGFIGDAQNYYAAGDSMSHYGDSRHASVRQRSTAGRRISAAELENLMIRQQNQQYQQLSFDQESLSSQTAKKYNSVSDMKRRKQRCAPSPQQGLHRTNTYDFDAPQPLNSIYGSPMKTYGSSPDIPRINSFELTDEDSPTPLPTNETPDGSEYSRPFRPPSRPKTPPPPPPVQNMQNHSRLSGPPSNYEVNSNSSTVRGVSRLSAVSNIHVSAPSPSAPPPAPPPPPAVTSAPKAPPAPSGGAVPPPPPPPPADLHLKTTQSAPVLGAPTPSRSILASALQNQASALRKVVPPPEKPTVSSSVPDFQADLRNALAKRRSKVANEEDDDEKRDQVNNRLVGLSLRESVRENVSHKDSKQHSPPGIAHKKDSGYTSSRTSLERSEYGDDRQQGEHVHPTFTLDNTNHKVSIISQNIEENYGRNKQQPDTISISSFSTISGSSTCAEAAKKPHLPPVDYDFVDEDPDSGTGDSDGEFRITNGSTFERKSLADWSCGDVLSWLHSIALGEYSDAFRSRRVSGSALATFDRTAFTQLGVTRIAHRQKMENSIRNYLINNDN